MREGGNGNSNYFSPYCPNLRLRAQEVTYITLNMSQNVRYLGNRFDISQIFRYNYIIRKTHLIEKRNKMAVATATYKVGDLYTSQKSKVTGTIQEIVPSKSGETVRVKLDVNGSTRWTTWTAKSE